MSMVSCGQVEEDQQSSTKVQWYSAR